MDRNFKSKELEHEYEADIQDIPCLCSQRWILGYLGFLFGMVFCIFRSDMNIAIVCMAGDVSANVTDYVNISREDAGISDHLHNVTYSTGDCEGEYQTRNDLATSTEFTWDRTMQSHVLSAYYYGFVALQIPCSWFIGRFGGKNVATMFTALASITTLLIPVLARTHVYGVLVARTIVGIASAPLPAAWVSLVGKWALPNERSRMMMVYWCGQTTGVAIGFSTSGWLCVHGFDNGWGSIFYVHGIIGMSFVVLWIFLTANSPDVHPRITDKERQVLMEQCKGTTRNSGEFFSVPWKEVFTSLSVWSIFVAQFCDNVMYYLILICLPLYIKEILRTDIQSNGIYSSLPILTTIASLVSTAFIADFINSKGCVSRTTNRKIFQITSFLVASAFLVLTSYMSCDQTNIVILLFCLCTFFQSSALSAAYPCNMVDMTPRYASYIYSVSNTIGATLGFIVPLAVAYLTRHKAIEEWRFVFWLTAGVSVLGSVVYGLFSTSEPVSWDTSGPREIVIVIDENKPFIQSTHECAIDTNSVCKRGVEAVHIRSEDTSE